MRPADSSRVLYFRLLAYVRPHWRIFAVAVLGMAATAATEPLFPALMKPLLDGTLGSASGAWAGIPNHILFPLAIVGIFVLRGGLGLVADYAMHWVSNRTVLDLRRDMFARLIRLPSTYFENNASSALISKVVYDVWGVTGAATTVITVMVKDTLAVLGLLGWLFYLNWKLTLVAVAVIPFIVVAVALFGKRLRAMSRGVQQANSDVLHVLQESIEAHKVVKIFGGQPYEEGRFGQASQRQRGYAMKNAIAGAALSPIVQVMAAVALAVIVGVALQQTANNQTTVGGFVSFITAMLLLLAPMKRLTDVNSALQRGLAAAESVFELIDQEPERDPGRVELGRARGEVRFEAVRFQYPGTQRPALAGIDLTIAPGETVAMVGASGSGKTTLANLLPRFHSVDSGRIVIDGHDIGELTLGSLRANIALVSQDVVLFNDTIAANIAYGSMKGATPEEIVAAAKAAHADEFIVQMTDGYDTLIGENGVRLSGGQRQRLAIARALLKNAPILILDEATSALDTQSERAVQAALETLMKNRSTLVIAHRLSTIENADRIVVLQHGHVVECGRHAELLALDGAYAALHRLQRAEESA